MKHLPSYFSYLLPILMTILAHRTEKNMNVEAVTTTQKVRHYVRGLVTTETDATVRKGKGDPNDLEDSSPFPPTPVANVNNGISFSTAAPTAIHHRMAGVTMAPFVGLQQPDAVARSPAQCKGEPFQAL